MKKLKWKQAFKIIWFLILMSVFVGIFFVVKYYLQWPAIIIVAGALAFGEVRDFDRIFKEPHDQPKEKE